MGSWRDIELVEALLAAAVLAVLVWAARERTRLRWLSLPDAPTYPHAVTLLSRAWRSVRRKGASRVSSMYLFPYLTVWG